MNDRIARSSVPLQPDWLARLRASALRKTILKMAFSGSTVHIGCAFSIVEILAVLYRKHLRLESRQLSAPERDYVVLSKGHGVMAQYACLHAVGGLDDIDIERYFADGTRLKGLSDAHVPGLEVTSGSLGHGLSVGVGLALGAKRKNTDQYTFAIVGDGEMNEGTIWEALLFAAHFKLDKLIVIVDENNFQAMGATQDVMSLGSIKAKFDAFDYDCLEVDGHDEEALDAAITTLRTQRNGRPKAIVAHTVKGKGVSFMECNNVWHYTRLTPETYDKALAELAD
jgi:transketolase